MKAIYILGMVFGTGLGSTIKAMMVACILPFVWAMATKKLGGFKLKDNSQPRDFLSQLSGMAARANAAQANSYESLPMFLAGVLLALYTFVPQIVVNGYAWAYVILRVLFGLCYIFDWVILRSITWMLSLACIFMLFIMSLKMVGAG